MAIDNSSVQIQTEVKIFVGKEDFIKALIEMVKKQTGMRFKPEHAVEQYEGQYDEAEFTGYAFVAKGPEAQKIISEMA